MKTVCILIIIMCAVLVLLWIGAYNDIGPLRFIGGYPGFELSGNPSSSQEV